MKTKTILILLVLTFIGCKKEQSDRTIDVIGYGKDILFEERHCGNTKDENYKCSGSAHTLKDGIPHSFILKGEYGYELKINGNNDTNSVKLIVNGKVVYHQGGKHHHINL